MCCLWVIPYNYYVDFFLTPALSQKAAQQLRRDGGEWIQSCILVFPQENYKL